MNAEGHALATGGEALTGRLEQRASDCLASMLDACPEPRRWSMVQLSFVVS